MRSMTSVLLLIVSVTAFSLGCSHPEGENITGNWTTTIINGSEEFDAMITFEEDGSFLFQPLEEVPGHNVTPAQYQISDSNITFTDEECGNSGVYSFSIADNHLTLTPDNDPCDHRSSSLSGIWLRAEVK